jgi:hypothetical protein|nr:MAG TPA: hypothetical protein [Caudoviricetes sp.]
MAKIKKYIYLIAVVALIGLIVANCIGWRLASRYKQKESMQRANVGALMQSVERYKVNDSLNAVRVHGLTLTIEDLKKYRPDDVELAKEMDVKNKHLGSVTHMNTRTTTRIVTRVRDSIVYIHGDTIYKVDTLRCFSAANKWFWFDGCINNKGQFVGTLKTYDKLRIIEEVRYKRFLFWPTNKIKSRKVNAVSDNPNTTITDIEFIQLIK